MYYNVVFVVGTRPEAIKVAPVYLEAKRQGLKVALFYTGQGNMALDALKEFGIQPDIQRDIENDNSSLANLSAAILSVSHEVFATYSPELVVVQGDTMSVAMAAWAASLMQIPVAHIEAGLRTYREHPFPEEMSRRIVSNIANIHFAPTEQARRALHLENIQNQVHTVGNTVVDAIVRMIPEVSHRDQFKQVLITCHRRENLGRPLLNICTAVKKLATKYSSIQFVWPVHPNPLISKVVHRELGGFTNVNLCQPLSYQNTIKAEYDSILVMTDSGGIQEECVTIGRKVLVLRNETERPEVVESGIGVLVGSDINRIVSEASRILDADDQKLMPSTIYGDGMASERIVQIIKTYLDDSKS